MTAEDQFTEKMQKSVSLEKCAEALREFLPNSPFFSTTDPTGIKWATQMSSIMAKAVLDTAGVKYVEGK